MKLLTFYMDLAGPELQRRIDALGEIVKAKKPEFVALQNVTNDTIKKVQSSRWGSLYKILQPPYKYETRKKPTTALMSTYPHQDNSVINFHESPSGKISLNGYYVMYDKQKQPFVICVGTTSLEQGLKVSDLREKQLNEACLSMIDAEDGFLMGGFGLDNDIDGELILKGGWGDAWLNIPGNTESTGYTYNPDKNPLIKEDPFGPGRPDRLFYKTRHYKLDCVELIGNNHPPTASSAAATTSVTISTHYGVLTQFSTLECVGSTTEPKMEPSILSAIFNRTEWSVQFQESKSSVQFQDNKSSVQFQENKSSVQFQENKSKEKSGVDAAENQWSVVLQESSH